MSGKVSFTTRIVLRFHDQDLFRIVCFVPQPLCIVHCIMQSLASDPLCVATVVASLPSSTDEASRSLSSTLFGKLDGLIATHGGRV